MKNQGSVRGFSLQILLGIFILAMGPGAVAAPTFLPGKILRTDYKVWPGSLVKVAIFDVDKVIRTTHSGNPFPKTPNDIWIYPDLATRLPQLDDHGYLIAFMSNQGGVAQGQLTWEAANEVMTETIRLVEAQTGVKIHYYDFAAEFDHRRKPDNGMFAQLSDYLLTQIQIIDQDHSFVVGDRGVSPFSFAQHPPLKGVDFQKDSEVTDQLFASNSALMFFREREFFSRNTAEGPSVICNHLLQ